MTYINFHGGSENNNHRSTVHSEGMRWTCDIEPWTPNPAQSLTKRDKAIFLVLHHPIQATDFTPFRYSQLDLDYRMKQSRCQWHRDWEAEPVSRTLAFCGKPVQARGLHGLAWRKISPRHQRNCEMSITIWRVVNPSQIPTLKEPLGLMSYGKQPDGVTLILSAKGISLAWDFTVPGAFATSHIHDTVLESGAAADQAGKYKSSKVQRVVEQSYLLPCCYRSWWFLEYSRCWISSEDTVVTEDSRWASVPFQRLQIYLQLANVAFFLGFFPIEWASVSTFALVI